MTEWGRTTDAERASLRHARAVVAESRRNWDALSDVWDELTAVEQVELIETAKAMLAKDAA